MKPNTAFESVMLTVVLGAGLSLAGCGGDDGPGFFVATWKGAVAGTGLTLQVTEQVTAMGKIELRGNVSSDKLVCLNKGPLFGTVVDKTVQLSAQGSGNRSRFTLVDIAGELADATITGTLTMIGDDQNEELCDFDRAPIMLRK